MNTQGFIAKSLTRMEDVLSYWSFFLEGLEKLNEIAGEECHITPDTLAKTLMHAAAASPHDGQLLVVTSKNGKPLLWGVALNNTALFKPKSCVVYAVYTNEKAAGVVSYAIECLEVWARTQGYKVIQAFSPSFSGSRFRLFERVWKFRRTAVLFSKTL